MDVPIATKHEWLMTVLAGAVTMGILTMSPFPLDAVHEPIPFAAICLSVYWLESKSVSLGPAGFFSPAPILVYLTSIVFGPWGLLVISAIWLRTGKRLVSKLYNICQYVIHGTASAVTYHLMIQSISHPVMARLVASLASILVFFAMNLGMVCLMKVLTGKGPLKALWRMYYAPIVLPYIDNLVHGALCVIVYQYLGWPGILQAVVIAFSKLYIQQRLVAGELGRTMSAETLIKVIGLRDQYTKDHSERVALYAKGIATTLGLSATAIAEIELAARLHDIGKIAVPDAILLKNGPLTPDEFDHIREHPVRSQQILDANPQLKKAATIAAQHHERVDGKGYPMGLHGDQALLEARIVACADAFDAMTTDRPYRRALSIEQAIKELITHSGTQFDPLVVRAMTTYLDSKPRLMRSRW